MNTVQQQTAKTILKESSTIKIGNTKYTPKPLKLSAFIKLSAIVSAYPQVDKQIERTPEEVLKWVLLNGKRYNDIGAILALLIMGWRKYPTKWFKFKFNRLATKIEDNMCPSEFEDLTARLLNDQETARFFGLTAFLSELNLLTEKRKGGLSGDSL